MKIKKLHIENYKSIRNIQLENPKPFSVFVGPNGAGKSNIFEAIEFGVSAQIGEVFVQVRNFGGKENILNFNSRKKTISVLVQGDLENILSVSINFNHENYTQGNSQTSVKVPFDYKDPRSFKFLIGFSRFFLNNSSIKKINREDNQSINSDGSNLEKVLNRILQDETKKAEIIEWLQVLIPEFKDIQIETSKLSGDVNYVIFEKHTQKPFPKHLISDGTKNILALLTAVYQSDEPQFLCIEEPENGLHPHVIENLVSFFRNACEEKGHYIWLNTHSQTLVRQLTVDEIIVVEKKQGATTARQFQGEDLFGMKMDEAWLTNALGGGLP